MEMDADELADVYWQRREYIPRGEWPSPEETKRSQEISREMLI